MRTSQPFDTDAVVLSIETVTSDQTNAVMEDGIQRFRVVIAAIW
jgi:hypothetical protein